MPRFVYLALILLSLIWGGSFYFIKMLLHDFGPWTIAFLRSFSGLATVTAVMLALRKPFGFRAMPWRQVTLMALINTAIPWALIAFGENHLSSSLASILNATTPIWTIVVGMAFFGSRTNRMQWLGLAIAAAGLIEVLGIRPGTPVKVDLTGFVCLMASSFCYATGSQLSKRLSGSYSMYQITYGTLLPTAVASGMMAFTTENVPVVRLASGTNPAMIAGLGIMGSGIGYILFYYLIREGSAEFATMVTYLVPGTALLWGYALLQENIEWNQFAGLCVILAGVYLASRKPRQAQG